MPNDLPIEYFEINTGEAKNKPPISYFVDRKLDLLQEIQPILQKESYSSPRYYEGITKNIMVFKGFIIFKLIESNGTQTPVYYAYRNHPVALAEGDFVGITGRFSCYRNGFLGGYSDGFQIEALQIERKGKAYTKLQELAGYIYNHKVRKQPSFIFKHEFSIALVTSQKSESIQDIHSILDRYPYFKIDEYYANLLNDEEVSGQIEEATNHYYDAIIVTRGGTDMTEAFNSYSVVNIIFKCQHLVITAIGHASTNTLSDYASDISLNTPTDAAKYLEGTYKDHKRRVRTAIIITVIIIVIGLAIALLRL